VPEIVINEFFASRVRHLFNTARDHFSGSSLEVARPPAGTQLLVGDSPALSIGR
jgi:hypothetical protein